MKEKLIGVAAASFLIVVIGALMEDYGLVISESFAVTETGAQTFADFPRKLFHLG